MCGIWLRLGEGAVDTEAAERGLTPRGPEGARRVDISGVGTMLFTRLAINGLTDAGMQPMSDASGQLLWMCNGEIYNHRELAARHGLTLTSDSDCEVIGPLYEKFLAEGVPLDALFRALDGVFALVIVDLRRREVIVARDPYGVRPLYIAQYGVDTVYIASEIKSIMPYHRQEVSGFCTPILCLRPGMYRRFSAQIGHVGVELQAPVQYHTVPFLKNPAFKADGVPGDAMNAVRVSLEMAVRKRMMAERPVAALLSGGVDSSLIAALVARELKWEGRGRRLQTFSIGMRGSSDLAHARLVADWIGSDHHEIILTADDFFAAIPIVIRDIESFDTTTVRASVGNWLVARAVRQLSDCKVVFNGDGADEIWGSYLYFYNAPSDEAFEAESERLLRDIHMFDVLRSDRSISSHGLEPRTPYLDKEFVCAARSVATAWRRPMPGQGQRGEKWLMRMAFSGSGLLPQEVLWRRKEAFSDGVSGQERSWYEIAQEKAAVLVPADWEAQAAQMAAPQPATPEQFYYRMLYEECYGKGRSPNVPYFWMPRWCGAATDPSARTLAVYKETESKIVKHS